MNRYIFPVATRFTVKDHPVIFNVSALDTINSKITAEVLAANSDTDKARLFYLKGER